MVLWGCEALYIYNDMTYIYIYIWHLPKTCHWNTGTPIRYQHLWGTVYAVYYEPLDFRPQCESVHHTHYPGVPPPTCSNHTPYGSQMSVTCRAYRCYWLY